MLRRYPSVLHHHGHLGLPVNNNKNNNKNKLTNHQFFKFIILVWHKNCWFQLDISISMLWSSSGEMFSTRCFDQYAQRRRSEHTDRNVELKPMVLFRTSPTHWEIIITWCYCKLSHVIDHLRKTWTYLILVNSVYFNVLFVCVHVIDEWTK